jgi:capsular exopolysaccharide synthesis family protein
VTPRDPGLPEPAGRGNGHAYANGRIPGEASHAGLVRGLVPTPPPALAAGPDLRALLGALARRWLLAMVLGGTLAAAAAVGAWLLLSAKYTAFAQLRVASTAPYIVFDKANNPEGRSDFALYQRTQAALLKNRYVLNAALKQEEVKRLAMVRAQADPLTWLEDGLKVEVPEGSEIITVKLSGPDPTEVVTLVDAVTQAYLKEIVDKDSLQRSDRLAAVDKIYNDARDKVHKRYDALRQQAGEAGGSDKSALTHKQTMLLQTFGLLKNQLAQVRFERMRAEGRLTAYKSRAAKPDEIPVPESAVKAVLDADPKVVEYRKRILQVEDLIDKYVNAGAPRTDSAVVMLQGRRASLEKRLETHLAELRPAALKDLRLRVKDGQTGGLAQLEDELAPLLAQEKALSDEVLALEKEADKIGTSSTEMEILRAEIKLEQAVMDRVSHELNSLQVELRSPPRVTLSQRAGLQKKDNKRQLLATALAPVAVLVGVCFCIGWWEFRARRIHSADEVLTGLGMRIVGTVPVLGGTPQGQLAGDGQDGHNVLESIDAIRTVLLRDASVQATRVLMVTSAGEGEGKTTLAGHLSGSLARAGRRTLLVDGDLRRPACHLLFELPLQPGFSEVLLEEIDLDAAVRPTAVDGLWVIPAGQWDRAVVQALAREGAQKVFDQLKEEFDFVIMDSHPVLAATDALLLGQHADAVIFSLLRGVSQLPHVYAAGQQLTTLGVRVLGAVINGMAPEDVYRHSAGPAYGVPAMH